MISIPATPAVIPILVELLVDASERSSVEGPATQATFASHLEKSNLVVEMDIEMRIPNPSTYQVYFRDPKDGAKMVARRVDT